MKKTLFIILAGTILTLFACNKEKAVDPKKEPEVTVNFTADVLPIFKASCGTGGTCHGTSHAADGKIYETHAGASAVPGSSTKEAINHTSGSSMPKNTSKLSQSKIDKIEAWIDGGMKND